MRILIADDEALWANLIKGIFEGHNFEVIITLNGKQVPEIAARENVDLILLDVNFPDTNGFIICEQLSSNLSTRVIPVVLLTAQSDPSDLKHGLECGAWDYVEKQSSSLELLARVQSVLRKKTLFSKYYIYNAIVEESPYATALIFDNKFTYLNHTFLQIFDLDNLESTAQIEYSSVVCEDDIPYFQSLIDQVWSSGGSEFFTFTGKKVSGKDIKLDANLKKIRVNDSYFILLTCKIKLTD